MSKKAMLLKVLVQTVWIEIGEDGTVEEKVGGAVAVPAANWPNFYEQWQQDFNALSAQVALESAPFMNRSQRRSKDKIKAKVDSNGE